MTTSTRARSTVFRRPWIRVGLLGLTALTFAVLLLIYVLAPPSLVAPERADITISGVQVLNPRQNPAQPGDAARPMALRPDQTLVIRDGRIAEIRARRVGDPAPICAGCFAVPGLIDAHVHTPPRLALGNQALFSLLYLANGVTSVRDVGQSDNSVAALADALNSGQLVGPHMYRCGPVLEGDPPAWPSALIVRTAADGRAAVDRLAGEGVDCIKVYNELSAPAFAAVAAAAARHRLPLLGHVPHGVGLAALADGFEVQHMTGLPYLHRPRPPVGSDSRDQDYLAMQSDETTEGMAIARRKRLSFTPTLANVRVRLVASVPGRYALPAGATDLPAIWQVIWNQGLVAGYPTGAHAVALREARIPITRALVGRAHAEGLDILAGTDALMPWVVPGASLHDEMAELALSMGDAEAALASATVVNGMHMAPGEIGVLAVGARADLLLLRGDPRKDLQELKRWRVLFADGRRYDRALVDGWMQRYRAHFRGTLYEGFMALVVRIVGGSYAHVPNHVDSPAVPDVAHAMES